MLLFYRRTLNGVFLNDKRCQNLNDKRWKLSKKIERWTLNGISFLNGNKPAFDAVYTPRRRRMMYRVLTTK